MKTITRIKKIAAIIACVLVSIGVMICASSCFIFWGNADFKIDLPIGFSRQEKENYEAYYTSSNMTVSIEREFYQPDGYQKGLATVKEYAIEVEDRWKLSKGETSWSSEAIEEDGLTYFIYEDDELGEEIQGCCFVYKSADSYWSVRFACAKEDFDAQKANMIKYAKTMRLKDEFKEVFEFEKIEGKNEYRVVGFGTVISPNVVVPAKYNGLPVTDITLSFQNKTIESFVFPDTITEVKHGFFAGEISLKRVQLGNATTKIDKYAFKNCTRLEEVVMPNTVKSIDMEAFAYCYSLKQINLGCVESIGTAAFFNCTALESITIPSTMKQVGYSVFAGCEAAKTLQLPDTIEKIGEYAFQGCASLTEVVIPNSVNEIMVGAFDQCFTLKRVTLPDAVETIGNSAFAKCNELQYNEYEGALYLGSENNPYLYLAGYKTDKLAHGKTHADTRIIASSAFRYCYNLMTFEIGESVTKIGHNAFDSCERLWEVYNKSALNITAGDSGNGGVALYAQNVYTEKGQGKVIEDENGFVLFDENGERVLLGYNGSEKDLVLPKDITEIYKRAFYKRADIEKVVMGDLVEKIGEYAFVKSELYEVTLSKNLSYIGKGAFQETLIDEVVFYDSLKTIEQLAFAECMWLEKINFGNSIETIGTEAFKECNALKEVTLPGTVISLGMGAFSECSGLERVIFSSGTNQIERDCFYSCGTLKEIVLPNTMTAIASNAFQWCNNIQKIYFTEETMNETMQNLISANDALRKATTYYYLETEPAKNSSGTAYNGNYWRYVDGVPTAWVC